jgi:uncharacterized protein (TIGR00661 family)
MRIIYGISGEGYGHAVRSAPIIDELRRKHQVMVLGGNKAHAFHKGIRIASLLIHYRNNSVSDIGTTTINLVRAPAYAASFIKTAWIMATRKPHVVVSDYEPWTCYAALLLGIPLVNVGNQYLLTHTDIKTAKGHRLDAWKTNTVTRMISPAGRFLITSFVQHKPTPGAYMIAPPLRKEITRLKPRKGKNLLVYQTSESNTRLVDVLRRSGMPCVIYGLGKKPSIGKCIFKTFNQTEFYDDLASAKAIITNGGHTLISEAIHLRKPILSIPVRKQYEQISNAISVEKLGCGMMAPAITDGALQTFIGRLDQFSRRYRRIDRKNGVDDAVRIIELTRR